MLALNNIENLRSVGVRRHEQPSLLDTVAKYGNIGAL